MRIEIRQLLQRGAHINIIGDLSLIHIYSFLY